VTAWKLIASFPDYEVSDAGGVRRATSKGWARAGAILKPQKHQGGYAVVKLRRDGFYYHQLIHRLVCEAFHGAPSSSEMQACHGDGDRKNNHATNLRWATRVENEADKELHGTRIRGLSHPNARFSATDIERMRDQRRCGASTKDIIQLFGVSPQHLSQICSGKKRVAG
jgi:hypothetical protein